MGFKNRMPTPRVRPKKPAKLPPRPDDNEWFVVKMPDGNMNMMTMRFWRETIASLGIDPQTPVPHEWVSR